MEQILTAEQTEIINRLHQQYGISPKEILFFNDKPEPFLNFEATCDLANQLVNLTDILLDSAPCFHADSIAARCTLTLEEGKSRSAIGIAYTNERINETELNSAQIFGLASARAVRNALRAAGIDLLKLALGESPKTFKSLRTSLIGQAHTLGYETGLIAGNDKTVWRRILQNRYGADTSGTLSEEELSDLVAFLKSLLPPNVA